MGGEKAVAVDAKILPPTPRSPLERIRARKQVVHERLQSNDAFVIPKREENKILDPGGVVRIDNPDTDGLAIGIVDQELKDQQKTAFALHFVNDNTTGKLIPAAIELHDTGTGFGERKVESLVQMVDSKQAAAIRNSPQSLPQIEKYLSNLKQILPNDILAVHNIDSAWSFNITGPDDEGYYKAGGNTETNFENLAPEKRVGSMTIIRYFYFDREGNVQYKFLVFGNNFADKPNQLNKPTLNRIKVAKVENMRDVFKSKEADNAKTGPVELPPSATSVAAPPRKVIADIAHPAAEKTDKKVKHNIPPGVHEELKNGEFSRVNVIGGTIKVSDNSQARIDVNSGSVYVDPQGSVTIKDHQYLCVCKIDNGQAAIENNRGRTAVRSCGQLYIQNCFEHAETTLAYDGVLHIHQGDKARLRIRDLSDWPPNQTTIFIDQGSIADISGDPQRFKENLIFKNTGQIDIKTSSYSPNQLKAMTFQYTSPLPTPEEIKSNQFEMDTVIFKADGRTFIVKEAVNAAGEKALAVFELRTVQYGDNPPQEILWGVDGRKVVDQDVLVQRLKEKTNIRDYDFAEVFSFITLPLVEPEQHPTPVRIPNNRTIGGIHLSEDKTYEMETNNFDLYLDKKSRITVKTNEGCILTEDYTQAVILNDRDRVLAYGLSQVYCVETGTISHMALWDESTMHVARQKAGQKSINYQKDECSTTLFSDSGNVQIGKELSFYNISKNVIFTPNKSSIHNNDDSFVLTRPDEIDPIVFEYASPLPTPEQVRSDQPLGADMYKFMVGDRIFVVKSAFNTRNEKALAVFELRTIQYGDEPAYEVLWGVDGRKTTDMNNLVRRLKVKTNLPDFDFAEALSNLTAPPLPPMQLSPKPATASAASVVELPLPPDNYFNVEKNTESVLFTLEPKKNIVSCLSGSRVLCYPEEGKPFPYNINVFSNAVAHLATLDGKEKDFSLYLKYVMRDQKSKVFVDSNINVQIAEYSLSDANDINVVVADKNRITVSDKQFGITQKDLDKIVYQYESPLPSIDEIHTTAEDLPTGGIDLAKSTKSTSFVFKSESGKILVGEVATNGEGKRIIAVLELHTVPLPDGTTKDVLWGLHTEPHTSGDLNVVKEQFLKSLK